MRTLSGLRRPVGLRPGRPCGLIVLALAPVLALLEPTPAAAQARINVTWRDGTGQLIGIINNLTPAQKTVLGIAALLQGRDLYAAEVTIKNTGTQQVLVSPSKIRITLGRNTYAVQSPNNAAFLQAGLLQPGQTVRGLVFFDAPLADGALLRLGGGSISYFDNAVEVKYGSD